jgi:hypothetical protein
MATPTAERQFIVTIPGIDSTPFAQKSGGDISADGIKVWNGGSLVPDVLAGPSEVDNISVTRPYDRILDADTLATLRAAVGKVRYTINVQPTDENLIASGPLTVYPNCLLVGFTELTMDASSGSAVTFGLSFLVPTVTNAT